MPRLHLLSLAIIVSGLLVLSHVSGDQVQAQVADATQMDQASAAAALSEQFQNSELELPQYAQEIAALKITLRDQTAQYRDDQRAFELSKQQYQQLTTLIALEQAVVATRQVMLSRNEVLLTYLEMVRLRLEETPGIALEDKEVARNDLAIQTAALKDFHDLVAATDDREGIAIRVTEFATLRPALENAVYRILSLVALGRLQTVYDQTLLTAESIRQYTATPDQPLKQAERDRAYRETQQLFSAIRADFQTVTERLKQSENQLFNQQPPYSRSSLTTVTQGLQPVYANLTQAQSYLAELLRI